MSGKNKIKRVSKIFILLIVVMSLVLWLLPLTSLSATPGDNDDGCPTTAVVPLKAAHQSKSWDAMEGGNRLFKDDCDNPIQPGPGEVVWHLVLSPALGTTTAWIDLNGNSTRDPGDSPSGEDGVMKGSGEGASIHWWILDGTTSQNWIANVTNPKYKEDCVLSTDLKVSHVCYGGDVPEKGSITVCKTSSGTVAVPEEFNFAVYPTGMHPAVLRHDFTVPTDGDCVTISDLAFGDYWVEETDVGYDVVISGDASGAGTSPIKVQVTISENTPNVTVSFDNSEIPTKGSITVCKT